MDNEDIDTSTSTHISLVRKKRSFVEDMIEESDYEIEIFQGVNDTICYVIDSYDVRKEACSTSIGRLKKG